MPTLALLLLVVTVTGQAPVTLPLFAADPPAPDREASGPSGSAPAAESFAAALAPLPLEPPLPSPAWLERPLFTPGRRPPAPPPTPEPVVEVTPEPEPTPEAVVLAEPEPEPEPEPVLETALEPAAPEPDPVPVPPSQTRFFGLVIRADGQRQAVVREATSPVPTLIGVGDPIEGWEIAEITDDGLRLRSGPHEMLLALRPVEAAEPVAAQAEPPSDAASPAPWMQNPMFDGVPVQGDAEGPYTEPDAQ